MAGARFSLALATLILTGCVVRLFIDVGAPIQTDDAWWHLALGHWMIDAGAFPATDPFLFTAQPGAPVMHEWLFQVLLGLVDQASGLPGLRLLHVVLVGAILGVMFRWSRHHEASHLLTVVVLIVFVLFAYQRLIQLRPHLISMLLFFLMWLGFATTERLSVRRIAALILAAILWCNVHSTTLIIFPFWMVWISALWLHEQRWSASVQRQAVALILCLAALTINPQGVAIYGFYFWHDSINDLTRVYDEWGHFFPLLAGDVLPWNSPVLVVLMILLLGGAALQVGAVIREFLNGRRNILPLMFAASSLLAACAMLYAVRFLWFAPILVLGAGLALRSTSRWLPALALGALTAAVGVHFLGPATSGYRTSVATMNDGYLSTHTHRDKFHADAVDFLDRLNVGGNLFHPYHLGGYLAYRLAPRYRTFMDGRFDRYPATIDETMQRLRDVDERFIETLTAYPIDFMVLPATRPYWRLRSAMRQLGWPVIHHDFTTLVLVRPNLGARPDFQEQVAAIGTPMPIEERIIAATGGDPDRILAAALEHDLPALAVYAIRRLDGERRTRAEATLLSYTQARKDINRLLSEQGGSNAQKMDRRSG